MPGYLAVAGLCRTPEEVLHKEQISQSSSPTDLQECLQGESFFPTTHPQIRMDPSISEAKGQTKVDFAISSCVEIGGMQV
jgi:hypothetical protein